MEKVISVVLPVKSIFIFKINFICGVADHILCVYKLVVNLGLSKSKKIKGKKIASRKKTKTD
jgi:hypothetical protein